ncbi:MAG: hypothetical protein A2Y65_07950 [Deltaproteobacteria bacterium RBG_13_52_11]|nr:MAG: hypothetical protein A2Y65_07950 [Deltaproteobacteria bacterium RBG_13_52_11]
MRFLILLLVLVGLAFPACAQDQATQLAEASAQITQALNLYAQAAEPIRSRMTAQEKLGTTLFFAAAMALEDNSLSLSGLCRLQQLSKSPTATKQKIVEPLIQQYRSSNEQQVANLSLALPLLPKSLARQANLVMVAVTNAAAIIGKGCQ